MFYPIEELGRDYARLRTFVEGLSFEDFEFTAFVVNGGPVLECKWRGYTSRIAIGPQHFQNEAMLMLAAKGAVQDIVMTAMKERMSVTIAPPA